VVTEGKQKQGTNVRVVKYSANGPTAMFTANMVSQRRQQNLKDKEKFSLVRWVVMPMDIQPMVFNENEVSNCQHHTRVDDGSATASGERMLATIEGKK
jgi:hypothetical protein